MIEVYRQPGPNSYQESRVLRSGDTLDILAFPGINIPVNDMLR